jgi:hypothetical protein
MIQAHINEERAAPLWAAVGVPLLGVPLMVALLALFAPGAHAPSPEEGSSGVSEHVVDVQSAEHAIADGDCLQQVLIQS